MVNLFSGPAITWGEDFNYFQKITVSNSNFNTNSDMLIPFMTQTVTFFLEGTGTLSYSFNGNTVHGDMTNGQSSATLTFENRVISKIWFKGTGTVRVEAWSVR